MGVKKNKEQLNECFHCNFVPLEKYKWWMVLLLWLQDKSLGPYFPPQLVYFCILSTPSHTQSNGPMSFLPAYVVFITGQRSDKHKGLYWKAGIPRITLAIVFPDPWFRSTAELVHIPLDWWCHMEAASLLCLVDWLTEWLVGWMDGWMPADS